jgi:hypothetical protein
MTAAPQSKSITSSFVPFLAVPRDRGDEACEVLSPVAFKVWYRVTRMTRGWQRETATISYNEFKRACGIKDSHTISAAIKELESKGFITVTRHMGENGRRFTSTYALQNAPAGHPPAAPRPSAPRSEKGGEFSQQARGNTPATRPMKAATPGEIPPVPPACQPAPQASAARLKPIPIHAVLDQMELPCVQEQTAVDEEDEPEEEREQESGAAAGDEEEAASETKEEESSQEASDLRGQRDELRRLLAALDREASDVYCLMYGSTYGTSEYEARKQRLHKIRADQQGIRAILNRL